MFDKPTRKLFLRQHAVRIRIDNSVMVYDLLAEFDGNAKYNTHHPVSFAIHAQSIGGENGGEFVIMFTKDNIWTVRNADGSSCAFDSISSSELIDTVCKGLSHGLDCSEEDELHESIMAYYRAFGEIDDTVQSLMFKGVMLTLKKYLTDLTDLSNIEEACNWSITPTIKNELNKAWERYYNEWANTEIA